MKADADRRLNINRWYPSSQMAAVCLPSGGDPDIKTLGGAIDPAGCVRATIHRHWSVYTLCAWDPVYVRPGACASQARWGHGVHLEAQRSPSGVRWDFENNTTQQDSLYRPPFVLCLICPSFKIDD
ncbi:unnamed protein product [Boreogadus saida]